MRPFLIMMVVLIMTGCMAPNTIVDLIDITSDAGSRGAADSGAAPVQPNSPSITDGQDAAQEVPDASPELGDSAQPTPDAGSPLPDADPPDSAPIDSSPSPQPDAAPDHLGAVWCNAGGMIYIGCDGAAHTFTIVTPDTVCAAGGHALATCSPGAQCEVTPAGGSITSGTCI